MKTTAAKLLAYLAIFQAARSSGEIGRVNQYTKRSSPATSFMQKPQDLWSLSLLPNMENTDRVPRSGRNTGHYR